MSGTVLVKSPVIPQWSDFAVTAPSGLVPWPAFYDGTEVVTVSGSTSLPWSSEFNTKVVAASWANNPNDIGFIHWLYQDANYIYLCWWSLIMDWSFTVKNLCVTRYDKTSYAIVRYEYVEASTGWNSIAFWVGIWVDWTQIHFFSANTWPTYSGTYFNTSTQTYTDYTTILSAFPWTAISWTGTRTNAPWPTLFEDWYNSNTITFWSYTLQWIFRFRYNNAASATPRKYVAGEWYISS